MHETNMYANEMHMMTWYAMHDTQAMTRQQQRITGGHLAHWSQGVTDMPRMLMILAILNLVLHTTGEKCPGGLPLDGL